ALSTNLKVSVCLKFLQPTENRMSSVGTLLDKPRDAELIALGKRKKHVVQATRSVTESTIPDDFVAKNRETPGSMLLDDDRIAHISDQPASPGTSRRRA